MPLLRFLPLLLLSTLAVLALALGFQGWLEPQALLDRAGAWLDLADSRPVMVFSALSGLIALATSIGLPGAAALFAASGFLLGPAAAIAAAAAGNVIGTGLLYLALRTAVFPLRSAQSLSPGTMSRIRSGFDRHPLAYALFLRAIPVAPNGAVTTALAALRCPWPTFVVASALGPLANAALLGWLGAQLAAEVRAGRSIDAGILGDPRWWLPLSLLAMLALIPVLLRRWRIRRKRVIARCSDSAC